MLSARLLHRASRLFPTTTVQPAVTSKLAIESRSPQSRNILTDTALNLSYIKESRHNLRKILDIQFKTRNDELREQIRNDLSSVSEEDFRRLERIAFDREDMQLLSEVAIANMDSYDDRVLVLNSFKHIFTSCLITDDLELARQVAENIEDKDLAIWQTLYAVLLYRHGLFQDVIDFIIKKDEITFKQKCLLFGSWAKIGTQEAYEAANNFMSSSCRRVQSGEVVDHPFEWDLLRSYLAFKSGNLAHANDIVSNIKPRGPDVIKADNLKLILLIEMGQLEHAIRLLADYIESPFSKTISKDVLERLTKACKENEGAEALMANLCEKVENIGDYGSWRVVDDSIEDIIFNHLGGKKRKRPDTATKSRRRDSREPRHRESDLSNYMG